MNLQIYDNFLSERDFSSLRNLLYSDDFPWFSSDSMTYDVKKGFTKKLKHTERDLLYHTFYTKQNNLNVNSNHFYFLESIFPFCSDTNNLYQIRTNLVMPSGLDFRHTPYHVDMYHDEVTREQNPLRGAYTGIYYLHGNSTPTIFKTGTFKRKLIFPQKNRLVVFPNEILHAHYLPVNKKRIVINFNFYSKITCNYTIQ